MRTLDFFDLVVHAPSERPRQHDDVCAAATAAVVVVLYNLLLSSQLLQKVKEQSLTVFR